MVQVGQSAPDFTLENAQGEPVNLASFAGKKVVLYFYPKDDTPGCTLEAIEFSRAGEDFAARNAVVIGISKDSCASHAKFASKHDLSVTLLSDPDAQVMELYGVWQEKQFMGKRFMGAVRTTYLIDEAGQVAARWDNVKVKGHVQEVLASL